MNSRSQPDLLQAFYVALDSDCIIDDAESMRPYECDGLSMYRALPLAVVMPRSIDQLQAVVRLCHEHGAPIVARGAGTSLCAGAMPHSQGVLLSLARFNQILQIDPVARSASVQPGVRNSAITEAAREFGLYYAPDPSSQIACSIGGNVAENSGGVHCLKYGLTVHNVLSVTAMLSDGEIITLGSGGLDSPGFDLLAIINGSEGMLAIILEITVKLLPLPEQTQLLMAGFDSVREASEAVASIIAEGVIPAGLEMMDELAIQAAEDFCQVGYPRTAAALLLCELDGPATQVAEDVVAVERILQRHNASSIRKSQDESERLQLWKGRKSAFPAIGRISPDYYCMDGTIPRGELAAVLVEMQQLSQKYRLRVANVFHAGDGNLHPLILFDESVAGEFERAEAFGADILALCVRVGGCITGEHGVGVEKIRQMHYQFSDAELQQFHRIKDAFDVAGILNPGKGIPELKHCQEMRPAGSKSVS